MYLQGLKALLINCIFVLLVKAIDYGFNISLLSDTAKRRNWELGHSSVTNRARIDCKKPK